MSWYEIPYLEEWTADNFDGTTIKPFLFNITKGKYESSSVLFHVKVGQDYYELLKSSAHRKNWRVWYIRCSNYRMSSGNCRFRARIEFLLDREKLETYHSSVYDVSSWKLYESPRAIPHSEICSKVGAMCVRRYIRAEARLRSIQAGTSCFKDVNPGK